MADYPLLSRLDLNLLVALDALLTERSVTRAAERLHLSQPALSASLARLRNHFNDPILARRGNAYELTPLALRLTEHTEFAGLWGGSTLPEWRRRGLYRALVSHRAKIALAQGYPYARVDTSPDSRPILTALGMLPVEGTRPFLLRAPRG